jgi:hypothetical protein
MDVSPPRNYIGIGAAWHITTMSLGLADTAFHTTPTATATVPVTLNRHHATVACLQQALTN